MVALGMLKTAVRSRKNVRVILPDSDKLGLVVASFCATLVLAANFFLHSASFVEVAFRVSLTFAVSWIATALLTHYMISATVAEIRAERLARRKARIEAEREIEEEAGEHYSPEGITGEEE